VLRNKTRDIDMTHGKIMPMIIKMVIPLIITNLLQSTYNVADSIIVSFSSEPDAVGAIGTTPSFINLLLNIFIGCSVGAKVLVANRIGAEDKDGVKRGAITSITLGFILGIICMIVACLVSRPVLRIMGNRGNLLELSVIYTYIYFLGMPFIALTNFSIALTHARGDTRTPLYVLAVTGLVNVFLNALFVFRMDMSVEGVALATLISNALSAIFLVMRVVRVYGIGLKDLKVYGSETAQILKIGMPAGIQGAIFSVSQMMIQSSIVTVNNLTTGADALYQPVVKGCAAATYIESIASSVTISLGQTAVPIISQNYGAKDFGRINKVRKVMYGVTFVVASVIAWSLLAFCEPLLSLFGIYKDGDALSKIAYTASVIRMKYMFIPYCFLGFMEVGAGVVQGIKRSTTAAITSLAGSCLLRVVWLLTVFKINPTLEYIFITFPLSWVVTAVAHFIVANVILKREAKNKNSLLADNIN